MTQPRLLGGRYELGGIVGRGGMAEVYRARDIRLDRQIAVKTLRTDLARDPTFQARFRREAQSAASLNHPAIIAVYDTGEDADQTGLSVPYIVMEYVEGRTLRELLQEDRRLLPERAAEIVDGVLRALDYSHRGGIVHRDIKPANVMVTRAGEVKVMDFGIARALSDTQATMTQTAQVIGTAQYLSPEQARGERVDSRSDIYSTGCVLYELLTGQPPFTGDSPVAIAYQHVREDPVPPSQIDPDIPEWADSIIFTAMAKDPNDRYQEAADMRADIQRALSGMPLAAPALVGSPTQGFGSTQMTDRTGGIPPHEYRPEDEYDEEPGRGKRIALWVVLALVIIGGAAAAGYYLLGSHGQSHVTVPSLVGKSKPAAEAALKQAGLKGQYRTGYSDQPKGKVYNTKPQPASTVAKGSTVEVYISEGAKKVKIPDVRGESTAQATRDLEHRGFTVNTTQHSSDSIHAGEAITTKPGPGSSVKKGSQVELYVSSGPNTVTVPDVRGMKKAAALRKLHALGFTTSVSSVPNDSQAPGDVFQQSPKAGTSARKGSQVTIFVAKKSQSSPPTNSPTPSTSSPGLPGFPGGGGNGGDDLGD